MAAPDKNARLWILLGVGGTLLVIALMVAGAVYLVPAIGAWVDGVFGAGLGLKSSAIIAAVVAFVVLVVLTLTAGDGLLGEIQFVIPGFFLFALFFWLMIAWVF